MKLPTIDEWNAACDGTGKIITEAKDYRAVENLDGSDAEKYRLAQANRLMRMFEAKTMAELELGLKMFQAPNAKPTPRAKPKRRK
jgi:hypothetical protein